MIVVDTTVLVYAVGAEHPLREPCRDLITAVEGGEVRATTTVEVIQELAHVRARRRGRRDGRRLAASYAALFAPLLTVDGDDLEDGLALFERSEELGAFDCVLAATTIRRGARALVSADRGFGAVRGLRHLDPADPEFSSALRPEP